MALTLLAIAGIIVGVVKWTSPTAAKSDVVRG